MVLLLVVWKTAGGQRPTDPQPQLAHRPGRAPAIITRRNPGVQQKAAQQSLPGFVPLPYHIVFQGAYERSAEMRRILGESRAILKRAGITDYARDPRNLVWAPNIKGQHTIEAARKVRDALRKAENNGTVLETLEKLGEKFAEGSL